MRNALSFDVEEYFHVEAFKTVVQTREWPTLESRVVRSTERLLDVLDRHRVSATFFVLGWVADRHPRLVREIRARGHEVGCHSYAHRVIFSMTRPEFRNDVRQAKEAIENAIGGAIIGYRAPTYSVVRQTMWALDILAEEGFRYDSSIFPIHHDRYGIPDAPRGPYRTTLSNGRDLVEFPISTLRVGSQNLPFSGGGYFRLLPYAVVRTALRRLNRRDQLPGIVYLHPWEVDVEQPRFPVRRLTRFRHYVNLDKTLPKLESLLGDFAFMPVSDLLTEHGFLEIAR